MNSRTTERFRNAFQSLPKDIQDKARKSYSIWKINSYHPSLKFKQIHSTEQIYSVRIGLGWRAVGVKADDEMIWFWLVHMQTMKS